MKSPRLLLSVAAVLAAIGTAPAYSATDIQFWHSMEGALGERVNALAADFNKGQ
ncbi:MAG: sn-glycerol-3-phosphate ABC transporter substrate-binding protein, partial [Burkholderiaceae bacterium]